jgi:peroxiredoxin
MNGRKFGDNDLEGIPHPGTYLVDSDGVIRAKLFLEKYQERHSIDELLEAAESIE